MYSSWATKQRYKMIFSIGTIFLLLFSAYIIISLYRPPTCFDAKKNQEELGVDCGGPCDLRCASQVSQLTTVWARAFEVSTGFWSALAYIENPNASAEVSEAAYKFTFFNRNGEVIGEREGVTYITHDAILPVFESRIDFGEEKPYRTSFEWLDSLVWREHKNTYNVVVEEQQLTKTSSQPEINATLVNKDPFPVEAVEVFAIVYDGSDNAIGVSKTFVDRLSARGKRSITFSWPTAFEVGAERWQLIVRVPQQKEL